MNPKVLVQAIEKLTTTPSDFLQAPENDFDVILLLDNDDITEHPTTLDSMTIPIGGNTNDGIVIGITEKGDFVIR